MMRQRQNRTVADLVQAMEEICPPHLAEPWDKVGLLLGDAGAGLDAVLLALDVTRPALQMAREKGCGLIICHHPLIFTPLHGLLRQDPGQALIMDLLAAKISVYTAHTNLDLAAGGVADCLAARICAALPGQPARQASLASFGRLLTLQEPVRLSQLISRVGDELAAGACQTNTDQDRLVRHLAVFPGSFSEDFIDPVRQAGADCILCGEAKHSTAILLDLAEIALVRLGHDLSERVVLDPLASRLATRLPDISFAVYPGLAYNKLAF